jgi:biopolymer transport protein ExbD
MNRILEVCLIAVTLAASITPIAGGAQALQKGVSVQMAATSNALPMPDADREDAWIVAVTADGSVYFGIEPITPAALAEKIKAAPSGGGKKLYIKADARTEYSKVVKVLEAAHAAGAEAPILLTSQPESSKGGIVAPRGLQVLLGPPAGTETTVVQMLTSKQAFPTVKVDDQQIPWNALQRRLGQGLQNASDKTALVKADGQLPFAQVAHVADVCSATGFRVVLVTPAE